MTVALTLGVTSAIFTAPAHAETRTVDHVVAYQGAVPSSVAKPVALAYAALAKAKMQAANRWVNRASDSLETVRVNTRRAHTEAMNLIGKPPIDPESDDPPGPPAVMAVLRLERTIGLGIVPLFNARKSTTFVQALGYTLYVTQTTRDKMLDRVIGLNPEGAGADFADDMADTVGGYTTEVNQIANALATYELLPVRMMASSTLWLGRAQPGTR